MVVGHYYNFPVLRSSKSCLIDLLCCCSWCSWRHVATPTPVTSPSTISKSGLDPVADSTSSSIFTSIYCARLYLCKCLIYITTDLIYAAYQPFLTDNYHSLLFSRLLFGIYAQYLCRCRRIHTWWTSRCNFVDVLVFLTRSYTPKS